MKMRWILILLVFTLLLTACDMDLVHEDHDNDGAGMQDHAPEIHEKHEEGGDHEEDCSEDNSTQNVYK